MPIKQMFDTAVTDVWTNAGDFGSKAGDIRWEGNRAYKCVQYSAAATAGQLMKYADVAGYNAHQVRASTSGAESAAGLCVTTALINQYGWIQIKGPAQVSVAFGPGSPTAGDALTPSVTSGAVNVWSSPNQVMGVALDGTDRLVLECPF